MEWMILPYRRYFDFSGRSSRKEYWMFFLLWALAFVALGIGLIVAIAGSLPGLARGSVAPLAAAGIGFWILLAVFGLFFLASLVPMIALQVRRLHDLNLSGWYYLAYFVGGLILDQVPNVGSSLNSLLGIGWIVLNCMAGTRGANRYGEDPLDPVSAEIFA
jgi:uncharacterized membrane protein YhaH (DUF805 family)